jgi:type I restriction enzyme M protein
MNHLTKQRTGRIKKLIARCETPMPKLNQEVQELEEKVNAHLQKMRFVWK